MPPGRDLGPHLQALGVGGLEGVAAVRRYPVPGRAWRQRDRQRPAGDPHHLAAACSISFVEVGEVGDDLQHPCARAAPIAAGDADQLLAGRRVSVGVGSPRLVRWFSVREVVKPSAPASHALGGEPAHLGDLRRRSPVRDRRRAGPSRTAARGPWQTWAARSMSCGRRSSASRYSAMLSHSQVEPFVQHGAGHVLDALHQLDQLVVVGRPHGREADAAVAHHDRGDAVPRRTAGAARPRSPGRRSGCGCRRSRA